MITHPEKVLFPDDGITKGELAAYYETIAPVMIPHIRARPVTMERYPAGLGKGSFWQKDVRRSTIRRGCAGRRSACGICSRS
jgi:bifunctional non-homologous end joining protein LigD